MENLNEVKLLHEKVKNNIFDILVRYKILSHVSSTLQSKSPLYFISEDYKFMFFEIPSEVTPFIESINRLLEIRYLQLISDPSNLNFYFITSRDYDKMSEEEKNYFIALPDKSFTNLFQRVDSFSFLDEIL